MKCPCCGQEFDGFDPRAAIAWLALTPRERDLCEILLKCMGRWISGSDLADKLYADDIDGGPLSGRTIISVMVYRLRPRLAAEGLIIESKAWSGYRLCFDPERQARRREAPNSAPAQATSRDSASLSPSVHPTIAE